MLNCYFIYKIFKLHKMNSKGNILKDSFYKERLARTSNHIIKGYTTTFPPPTVQE